MTPTKTEKKIAALQLEIVRINGVVLNALLHLTAGRSEEARLLLMDSAQGAILREED